MMGVPQDEMTRFKVIAKDPEEIIKKMFDYIKLNGDPGHSFPIVVDPDLPEATREFYFDGDGADYIHEVKVKDGDEEHMKEYEIIARTSEFEIKEFIEYIGDNGNTGHSFSIKVDDPDTTDEDTGEAYGKMFGWDGDGMNRIESLEVLKKARAMNESNIPSYDQYIAESNTSINESYSPGPEYASEMGYDDEGASGEADPVAIFFKAEKKFSEMGLRGNQYSRNGGAEIVQQVFEEILEELGIDEDDAYMMDEIVWIALASAAEGANFHDYADVQHGREEGNHWVEAIKHAADIEPRDIANYRKQYR